MNMILVCSNFQKLHLVALRNFKAYLFQYFINLLVKHNPAVLRRKTQVARQYRYVMTLWTYSLIPKVYFYAASGGEYDPKKFKSGA